MEWGGGLCCERRGEVWMSGTVIMKQDNNNNMPACSDHVHP